MKKLKTYLKFYYEPRSKDIREMAYQSALEYYSVNKDKKTRENFQAYQGGYTRTYRHAYAKHQMSNELAKLNLA